MHWSLFKCLHFSKYESDNNLWISETWRNVNLENEQNYTRKRFDSLPSLVEKNLIQIDNTKQMPKM